MAYHNHRNGTSRPSIYQTVTDRIISSLKTGVIPWEKPWKTPRYAGGPFPRNFYTGKPYRGINVLLLWSSEYSSPFWLTFKQAQALKGTVRKGEHGTQIIFYKQLPDHAEKDEEGTGEYERVPFVLCHYTVHMPTRSRFVDAPHYYNTFFHELIHSTGHESRLNRTFGDRFGDELYSKEELVA